VRTDEPCCKTIVTLYDVCKQFPYQHISKQGMMVSCMRLTHATEKEVRARCQATVRTRRCAPCLPSCHTLVCTHFPPFVCVCVCVCVDSNVRTHKRCRELNVYLINTLRHTLTLPCVCHTLTLLRVCVTPSLSSVCASHPHSPPCVQTAKCACTRNAGS